jgi:hypothetical protein
MDTLQLWNLLAAIVTVFGLPFAIFVFWHEKQKAREQEDEQAWLLLSDGYRNFLELVIANSDLKMGAERATADLDDEQREREAAMFAILISMFERAYLLLYAPDLSGKRLRRWHSWEDYMREWCRREDFRAALPGLLRGEDAEFAAYIARIAAEEGAASGVNRTPL